MNIQIIILLVVFQINKDFELMSTKKISIEGLRQLSEAAAQKKEYIKSIVQASLIEYRSVALVQNTQHLFQFITWALQNNVVDGPIFNAILTKPQQFYNSLLGYCYQNDEVLKNESFITVSHQQAYSQSLLLALFLAKQNKEKVDLVTEEKSLRGIGHLIASQTEADRAGFTKNAASKEGIILHNIASWDPHSWVSQDSIIIIDVFGLNPTEYRHFLLNNILQLKKSKKVVVYHNHLQEQEIFNQLETIKAQIGWFPIQLWPEHPLETIIQKNEQAMLQRLFSFLKEDSTRPDKQDAIIFVPAGTYVKRFISKLSEKLARHQLKQSVNLIFKPHQSKSRTKNNIFLTLGTSQLADWDYDYNNLFYVIDYETETNFLYDYSLGAFVRSISRCSGAEKAKRMAIVGSSSIGRYVCLSTALGNNLHYTEIASQLSSYVVRMISLGLGSYLQKEKRVSQCLSLLHSLDLITQSQNGYVIKENLILEVVKNGVNPVEAKFVFDILQNKELQQETKQSLANWMVMIFQVLRCGQNMHKYKVGAELMTNKQWDSIWRTSGYLQSCLVILTTCENIDIQLSRVSGQLSQAQNFKRLSSRISEDDQNSLFGSLFQLCQTDNVQTKLSVPDYLKKHLVNEQVFYEVRHRIDNTRQVLGIKPCQVIFQMQDLEKLFTMVIKKIPNTIADYTGFKRLGYKYQKQNIIAHLHKQNLHARSKQHPQHLFVFGLHKVEQQYQIMYANAVSSELLLSITGHLPAKKSQSFGEVQLQFHGISTSVFQQLLQKNKSIITNFESANNCIVEANQELATFIIHSQKQKSAQIKKEFETLLNKTKERIANVKKVINYLGNTYVLMSRGGQIEDVFKQKYQIDKCVLNNLHIDVTKEDLQDLFQQFFHLRDLVLNQPQPGAECKSAFLKFYSQKDYERFHQYFNGCQYFGLQMKIEPVKSNDKKQTQLKTKKYIEFKWFVWQSHGKALVRFATLEAALKTQEALLKNPKFDNTDVTVSREQNTLFLQNLNQYTDQIYIQQVLAGYGEIVEVEVMKSPIREQTNPDNQLQRLIKKVPGYSQDIPFEFQPVERKANGLRICRVNFNFQPQQFTNNIVSQLNKKIETLGQGRLYATLFLEMPILVPNGLNSLYLQILEECISDLPYYTQIGIKTCKVKHQEYIILLGRNSNFVNNVYNTFIRSIKPTVLNLSKVEKNILFTEIALSNIMYIQEKYRCKILVDIFKKELTYISTKKMDKLIKDQIKNKISTNFFYMLRLNSKAYKHFKNIPEQLKAIQQKFKLSALSLQRDSYSVLINGSVLTVEQAVTYLMHFTQSLVKPQQSRINTDLCGICCDPFKKPYRLQTCSHMFCTDCLKGCLQAVLKDVNLFPFKCPHCLAALTLRDLQMNLNINEWQKLKTIGINKYVGLNSQIMRFCYTIGCKQINILDGPTWKCETCHITYCNLCKETYHPGIKCEDVLVVRQSDEFFRKYLSENGGRLCPNPGCKMPCVKIEGCNKVQCTRCMKSMCFKCPPQQMIPYNTPSECYDHLNSVHGGYY